MNPESKRKGLRRHSPGRRFARLELRGRPAGQVIVLACVTLLVVALVMLTSFGIASAIHRRIQLQTHADALAFSVATVEARSMNVVAYQNRAFTATVVTMMTAHAWLGLANVNVRIVDAARRMFRTMRMQEPFLAVCPPVAVPPNPPPVPQCFVGDAAGHFHCHHQRWAHAKVVMLEQAIGIDEFDPATPPNFAQANAAPKPGPHNGAGPAILLLRTKDAQFNAAMRQLSASLDAQWGAQRAALQNRYDNVRNGGLDVYQILATTNGVPANAFVAALHQRNGQEFACAFEGIAQLEGDCARVGQGGAGSAVAPSPVGSLTVRSAIARSAANAARTQFETMCANSDANYANYGAQTASQHPTPGSGRRRCEMALHRAIRPNDAPNTPGPAQWNQNFWSYLLNRPGDRPDPNGTVSFRLSQFAALNGDTVLPNQQIGDTGSYQPGATAQRIANSFQFEQSRDLPPLNQNPTQLRLRWHHWNTTNQDWWIIGGRLPMPGGQARFWADRVFDVAIGSDDQGVWYHYGCKIGPNVPAVTAADLDRCDGDQFPPLAPNALPYANLDLHQPGQDHTAANTGWEGICNPLRAQSPCFINFRADSRSRNDYGQPSVYAAVKAPLGPVSANGNFKPWHLNAAGQQTIEFVQGQPRTIVMRPRYGNTGAGAGNNPPRADEAFAVSKAKVYYHEIVPFWKTGPWNATVANRHWRRPPNLFDPFWRAKLHPFRAAEKVQALQLSVDQPGSALLATPGVAQTIDGADQNLGYGERE